MVMSKTMSFQGKSFLTAQIEYEAYTEDELRPFFEREFETKVLPPIKNGRKFISENLDKLYFLTLNQEEVKEKLQGCCDIKSRVYRRKNALLGIVLRRAED